MPDAPTPKVEHIPDSIAIPSKWGEFTVDEPTAAQDIKFSVELARITEGQVIGFETYSLAWALTALRVYATLPKGFTVEMAANLKRREQAELHRVGAEVFKYIKSLTDEWRALEGGENADDPKSEDALAEAQ